VAGCGDPGDAAATPETAAASTSRDAPPIAVETIVIESAPFTTTIRATGVVVAARDIWVAAEMGGRVAERLVDPGASVDAGAPLLRIDSEPAEIALAQADAAAEAARAQALTAGREAERLRTLHDRGDITDSTRDAAELAHRQAAAAADQAEALLRAARRALRECTLRAPWPARVGEVKTDVGATVAPGYPLIHLISAAPPRLALGLPARDLVTLAPGVTAGFETVDVPRVIGHAAVRSISAAPDLATRTYALQLDLLPPLPTQLRIGMPVQVSLPGPVTADAIAIPLRALVVRRGESYAFVAVDDHAERRLLTLGGRSGSQVRVVAGVQASEALIVVGQSQLLDGSPIQCRGRAGDGPGSPRADSLPHGTEIPLPPPPQSDS
jgi:membrane fusion protein (multidrug efflux system)